jgi:hypothetical protein
MYMHNNHCHRATAHLQLNKLLLFIIINNININIIIIIIM